MSDLVILLLPWDSLLLILRPMFSQKLKQNLFKQNFVALNWSIWEKLNFEVSSKYRTNNSMFSIHCRAQYRCAHFWFHTSNLIFLYLILSFLPYSSGRQPVHGPIEYYFKLYRAENLTKLSHGLSLYVRFIMKILIRISPYYKND
jgi:hypothetical protein